MCSLTLTLTLFLLVALHQQPTHSLPTPPPKVPYRYPLIIWHGLGDTYANPALQSLADIYTDIYPDAPTHIIALSPNPSSDRTSTFFGHLPTQLSQVCTALLSLPPPFATSRLNLLGLSQGGQFLRALIQTCPFPHPPANLITFGSQHSGISKFLPSCAPADWTCKSAGALLERKKWSSWAQHNIVPAQYFRDPADLDTYLEHSEFLADINNERTLKNDTYKERLVRLDRFVMYLFEDDKTVFPKESSWFDDVDGGTGLPVKLRHRSIYTEDWLGLKQLDDKGALVFKTMPGEHMRLTDGIVRDAFKKYFAPVNNNGKEGNLDNNSKVTLSPEEEEEL
ncbi:palmitoyl-protein thioesterase 1 [Terfezia claveryi]|nr:palmitoyl-protein thioesterase 1 [Terfezia claveryi]